MDEHQDLRTQMEDAAKKGYVRIIRGPRPEQDRCMLTPKGVLDAALPYFHALIEEAKGRDFTEAEQREVIGHCLKIVQTIGNNKEADRQQLKQQLKQQS